MTLITVVVCALLAYAVTATLFFAAFYAAYISQYRYMDHTISVSDRIKAYIGYSVVWPITTILIVYGLYHMAISRS